jgi:hypothetical protein
MSSEIFRKINAECRRNDFRAIRLLVENRARPPRPEPQADKSI